MTNAHLLRHFHFLTAWIPLRFSFPDKTSWVHLTEGGRRHIYAIVSHFLWITTSSLDTLWWWWLTISLGCKKASQKRVDRNFSSFKAGHKPQKKWKTETEIECCLGIESRLFLFGILNFSYLKFCHMSVLFELESCNELIHTSIDLLLAG